MVISSEKAYIIYAYSFKARESIYRENVKTKAEAIRRGVELSAKNDLFYYLIYENDQTITYGDSLFKENKILVPIQKSTKSTLIAECRFGDINKYTEDEKCFS